MDTYENDASVFVFNPLGVKESGRKLRAPWMGPYRVCKKLSPVSYLLQDRQGRVSRAHVNRLTHATNLNECQDPEQGLFPDSRRMLRNLLKYDAQRGQYQVRRQGRNGFVWVDKSEVPDVVNRAYELSRGPGTEGDQLEVL